MSGKASGALAKENILDQGRKGSIRNETNANDISLIIYVGKGRASVWRL